jgi:hypothetical protein
MAKSEGSICHIWEENNGKNISRYSYKPRL